MKTKKKREWSLWTPPGPITAIKQLATAMCGPLGFSSVRFEKNKKGSLLVLAKDADDGKEYAVGIISEVKHI